MARILDQSKVDVEVEVVEIDEVADDDDDDGGGDDDDDDESAVTIPHHKRMSPATVLVQ